MFEAKQCKHWYAFKAADDVIVCNSSELDGYSPKEAIDRVAKLLAAKGLGEKKTTWRLHDWGSSHQRYWGTPIPIIHCDEHGAVPVPEKNLPVVLPVDCVPDGLGNPHSTSTRAFMPVWCALCVAKRRGARLTPWIRLWTPAGIGDRKLNCMRPGMAKVLDLRCPRVFSV